MFRQRLLEVSVRVTWDSKRRSFYVMREGIKSAHATKSNKGVALRRQWGHNWRYGRDCGSCTHWSEYSSVLHSGSCFNMSLRIIPVFNAISSFSYLYGVSERIAHGILIRGSYPANVTNKISCFRSRYSTVGHREPICRLRRWLNMCMTSFRASNSNLARFLTR